MLRFPAGKWFLLAVFVPLASLIVYFAIIDFSGFRVFSGRLIRVLVIVIPQGIGMLSVGWWIRTRFDSEAARTWMGSLLAAGLGLGAVSHLLLILGLLGLLYPSAAWLVFAGLTISGAAEMVRHRAAYAGMLRAARSRLAGLSTPAGAGLVLTALFVLYPVFTDVLIPPLEYDEIAYHLPIAQMYIDHHAIIEIPFIPYANWPTGFEMIFMFELLLSGDTAAHFMTYLSYLLLLGAAGAFVYRGWGGKAALVVVLVMAGLPTFQTLSGSGMIDVPLSMFTLFAVLCLLEWLRDERRAYLVLSALFAGFGASIKLNAAVYALILALFVLGKLVLERNWRAGIAEFARYGLVAGLVVLPWYLKSWIVIGSPFWPFLPEIFGARNWDPVSHEALLYYIRLANEPFTFQNWFTALMDISLNPFQYGYSYRLGPNLLVFTPLALPGLFLLQGRSRSVLILAGGIALALYTNWFLTTQQFRFFAPVIPLIAICIGMGVGALFRRRPGRTTGWVFGGMIVYFVMNSWLLIPENWEALADNWQYQTGRVTQSEYLTEHLGIFPAIEYLNKNAPADAYVLLSLYEVRGYYLERDYFWLSPVSQRTFPMETYTNEQAFLSRLRQSGFTHILFNPGWPESLDDLEYADRYEALIRGALDDFKPVFTSNQIEVYQIPTAGE